MWRSFCTDLIRTEILVTSSDDVTRACRDLLHRNLFVFCLCNARWRWCVTHRIWQTDPSWCNGWLTKTHYTKKWKGFEGGPEAQQLDAEQAPLIVKLLRKLLHTWAERRKETRDSGAKNTCSQDSNTWKAIHWLDLATYVRSLSSTTWSTSSNHLACPIIIILHSSNHPAFRMMGSIGPVWSNRFVVKKRRQTGYP